jgi:hypothetical protein
VNAGNLVTFPADLQPYDSVKFTARIRASLHMVVEIWGKAILAPVLGLIGAGIGALLTAGGCQQVYRLN